MQFFEPGAFSFLWLVPALAGLFWFSQKLWKRRLALIGYLPTLQGKLMSNFRPREWLVRMVFLISVFFFGILALARPQWGEEKRRIERKGVDIIFLLDTSLSMLAEDTKPSRLEKSKLEIKTFIRRLKGDRIGMVAFAGSSFLQTPLTLDYSAFLLFLDAIKPGYIPDPGTSLDRAVQLALKAFPQENLKHKVMILFSDGEDHEGGIETALDAARKAGVRIYTIGLGTANGEPIPLRDEEGRKGGFKKDRGGEIVITKLNQPVLEKVAAETGGLYFPSTPGEQEVDLIIRHMENLGKKQFKEQLVSEKEDHYQLFLFLALMFLVFEMLVRKSLKMPSKALALIPAFFIFCGFLESPRSLNEEANKLYQEKKYQSAAGLYRKARVKRPEDPTLRYNLATTDYQLSEYQEAAKELEEAIRTAKDPELKAKALYNYGNTQYRLGNFDKAIQAYQDALEINSKDVDAKYNLEFLQKEKSLFEKKDQERKKNEQQDQQPQPQKQQQEEQQQQSQKDQQQEQDQQQQQQQGEQEKKEEEGQSGQEEEEQKDEGEEREPQKTQPEEQGKEEEPQPQEEKEEEKPEEGGQAEPQPMGGEDQREGRAPLQGQMKLENALQILDALKESEKELQDLRRPPVRKDTPQPLKDW